MIHALHDEQDMKRMGGLRRYLPHHLRRPSSIGYLALSAIPPFDGFWSKDDVLQAAWHKSPALWAVGVVTAGTDRLLHEPPGGAGVRRPGPLERGPTRGPHGGGRDGAR